MAASNRTRRNVLRALPGLGLGVGLIDRMGVSSAASLTRLVVGFPAGGFVDSVSRSIAEDVKSRIGPTIVDVKAGAGGQIAVMDVKSSPPDGSSLLITPAAMITIYPWTYKSLRYDPHKDLTPIGMIGRFDLSIAVSASSAIKSLNDLASWYARNPGKGGFGTPGPGSAPHLGGYEILKNLRVDVPFVHYRGDPPQVLDIVGGALPAGIMATSVAERNLDRVRVLAITGPERSFLLRDVPTLRELGMNIVIAEWLGMFAPKGISADAARKLNAALNESLSNAEVKAKLATFGMSVAAGTQAEFARVIEDDTARWRQIVKTSGFVAE